MTDILPLRDYQLECLEALETQWGNGYRRLAVVLPTGAGKTHIFAHLIKKFHSHNPKQRALVLAHTDELVSQAVRRIKDVAPRMDVGIVKAGRDDINAHVIVASVQTLRNSRRRERLKSIGLVIVDECHRATSVTYRNILGHYQCFDEKSGVLTAGFTATLARGDKEKLSNIWEGVAYQRGLTDMVRDGHLLNVRGLRIQVADFDMSKVGKIGGDYSDRDLGEALRHSMAPDVVAKAYMEHAGDRSGLVFVPTVSAAHAMSETFNATGIRTAVVHGGMHPVDRRDAVAKLEAGDIQVIANCQALTEGFDAPIVSVVVVARPTRSAVLYQQMVGRALRLYPGQHEALVLDVVGVSEEYDLRSLVDLSVAPKGTSYSGRTLLELEHEVIRSVRLTLPHMGEYDEVEFDPLARVSTRAWGRTKGGTYFLSAGEEAYVFLCPSSAVKGSWDVAWCSRGRAARDGGFSTHVGMGMEYALAWGEDVARQKGGSVMDTHTLKSARWRRGPATDKQLHMAHNFGIEVPDKCRAGELSVLINEHTASLRIDPIVFAIVSARGK